jgi:glutathione S-transferase
MRLYVDSQFISPYAMSAFVSLIEKELSFDLETVDLAAKANHAPSYVGKSITRRVPTLLHDGFALSESSAISEYLDEAFTGNRLYPAELQDRAKARQVVPIRDERPSVVVFHGARRASLSDAARISADILFSAADRWLKESGDNLFGDWCISDMDMAMMLNRLIMHGDVVPERLVTYAARQWRRPSIQAWLTKVSESQAK